MNTFSSVDTVTKRYDIMTSWTFHDVRLSRNAFVSINEIDLRWKTTVIVALFDRDFHIALTIIERHD